MKYVLAFVPLFAVSVTPLYAQSACSSAENQPFIHSHATLDLLARYEDLKNDDLFLSFLAKNGGAVSRWSEELIDGKRRIVAETADDLHVISFDAVLQSVGSRIVKKPQLFDVDKATRSRSEALDSKLPDLEPGQTIQVHPRVRNDKLSWEVDVLDSKALSSFEMKRVLEPTTTHHFAAGATVPIVTVDDALAENSMHHINDFTLGIQPTVLATMTTLQKAKAVKIFVRDQYTYKALSDEMEKFIFADRLVRFDPIPQQKPIGAGLCDELSVVAISYLRNMGVRARLRFLTANGGTEAHAFVEFQDEAQEWLPLDVVYNNVGELDVYCSKMSSVQLMIAEKPDDEMSADALCFGVVDDPTDDKLNPYCDFTLTPDYPGQSDARYSACAQIEFAPAFAQGL